MTDERIFDLLAAHVGPAAVDAGFEDRLFALLQSEMDRPRRSARPALLLVAALLALIAVSAALVVGMRPFELPWLDGSPTPQASATASASASATASASASATASASASQPVSIVDAARPQTRSSYPPGEYWWSPAGVFWMHNPTANNVGVEITLSASPVHAEPGPTAAVIAGYHGTYRQPETRSDGTRTEVWIVQIYHTWITVTVAAAPEVGDDELAQAHRIVESLRAEDTKFGGGFRLIFTLPEGWDSA